MLNILRQRQATIANAAQRSLHTTTFRPGYIVLVPEIGEEGQMGEGLLTPNGLPAFSDITIEMCLGAIGQQASAVEKSVKALEEHIKSGKQLKSAEIYGELDTVTAPLETTWGVAKALYLGNSTLIPTKSYMNIHERARNARAAKFCNRTVYKSLLEQVDNDAGEAEQRLRQKFLLEGKLNGLSLKPEAQDGLKELLTHLGRERGNFKNKVNMAVHAFAHVVNDFQLVRDFPPTLLEATARDSQQPLEGPWKITLQPPVVDGFLKYCPDRLQRWNVWRANAVKASQQQDKALENSTHLEKIRGLRKRQANLLGYANYADMSMQTKMIGSVDNLKQIFAKLLKFAGPAQSVQLEELQKFASASGSDHKLEAYDVTYWARKQLVAEQQLLEDKLREFFPLPRVLSGLFALSEKLFNIRIVEQPKTEVWHPAVKFFNVYDGDASNSSTPVGGFYVDCYSKEHKFGRNNGWMVGIRNSNKSAGLSPLCALIFNFTEPTPDKPTLLGYDDLQMIFKTFGTALQHLLTQAGYSDLAGLSNIEWDASQVSGYVMSNFLDDASVLQTLSGHYVNDEIINVEQAQKMRLLKTQLAGYNLCQEIYLADLDVELHRSSAFWLDVVRKIWPVYQSMALDKKDAHPCSMTDIFAGDWAAAHFSHLYSKLLAADISSSFAEQRSDDHYATVGKRYKQTFLSLGGSVPTAEVFRRFQGRDPSVEALLKSLDIFTPSQTTENN
ncbi:probable cytosolic oligopeptidase A [Drosophila grimshawi]|uniref:GH19428 n=1 Tax=Drosophila grimshawi TaxID=7222 RepID=B4JRV7_DROGR|nr:probable cytosolic oligopeptidase A [Drosophila grimshawi]EDV94497.1 GH19428 [Drosophila grimshawi]